MPRGGGSSRGRGKRSGRPERAKGGTKYYSSFEEVMRRNAEIGSEENSGDEDKPKQVDKSQIDREYEDEESEEEKPCNQAGFEIVNPNYDKTAIEKTGVPELSRRQKEQLERIERDKKLDGLRAQGKTSQAKLDLARLAEVRARREQERLKKEEDLKQKELDNASRGEKKLAGLAGNPYKA